MMLSVMIHMFTRDATTGVVRESQEVLKKTYCKFPQTQNLEENRRCSSIYKLFFLLANGCSYQKDSREELTNGAVKEEEDEYDLQERPVMEGSTYEGNVGMEDADGRVENEAKEKDEEISSSLLIDSFVISLLVFSASVSLMEWYKERNKNAEQVSRALFLSLSYRKRSPRIPYQSLSPHRQKVMGSILGCCMLLMATVSSLKLVIKMPPTSECYKSKSKSQWQNL